MTKIQPFSRFIDTYCIISRSANTHSGKTLLNLNKRRTFNVIFKENSLLWIGCMPVWKEVL